MELNHLKYFYTVAREGSFTRASRVLKIQQPTVSKMVQSLEAQLGVQLLERHKKGVRVTRPGGEIFRTCEEIFDKVEGIRALSAAKHYECEGKLALGVPSSVSSYLLPAAMRTYLRDNPGSEVFIWTGTGALISQEILEGHVEFGIFFSVAEGREFQVSELAEVPFKLVVSARHKKDPDIRSCFVISRTSDYSRTAPFPVMEMLRRSKVRFKRVISSNNLDSQKQLVMEGLGVALLPAFMVRNELRSGVLSEIRPAKEMSYTLKLVTRRGKVLSRDAATFLEVFREEMGAFDVRPVP